jgi:hypothetical protein
MQKLVPQKAKTRLQAGLAELDFEQPSKSYDGVCSKCKNSLYLGQ